MALFIRHNSAHNTFELVQKIVDLDLELVIETSVNKEYTLKRYGEHIKAYDAKPAPNLLLIQHRKPQVPPNLADKGNNNDED